MFAAFCIFFWLRLMEPRLCGFCHLKLSDSHHAYWQGERICYVCNAMVSAMYHQTTHDPLPYWAELHKQHRAEIEQIKRLRSGNDYFTGEKS